MRSIAGSMIKRQQETNITSRADTLSQRKETVMTDEWTKSMSHLRLVAYQNEQ